jgi:hypothetical protein
MARLSEDTTRQMAHAEFLRFVQVVRDTEAREGRMSLHDIIVGMRSLESIDGNASIKKDTVLAWLLRLAVDDGLALHVSLDADVEAAQDIARAKFAADMERTLRP